MRTSIEDEPVFVTSDEFPREPWQELDSNNTEDTEGEAFEEPRPKCSEMLRRSAPNEDATQTPMCGILCLQPRISFQLQQPHDWSKASPFVAFNVWRPPYIGGVNLKDLGPNSGNYYRKDLILTDYVKDSEVIKSEDLDAIPFTKENVLAATHVEEPPLISCRCCFQHRGKLFFSNGECWTHREQDVAHHMFTLQQDENSEQEMSHQILGAQSARLLGQNPVSMTLVWEHYGYGNRKGVPCQRPLVMDRHSRVCRISETSGPVDKFSDEALAIMSPEGIVFCEGFEKISGVEGLGTSDLRLLVIMTGLAATNYDNKFAW